MWFDDSVLELVIFSHIVETIILHDDVFGKESEVFCTSVMNQLLENNPSCHHDDLFQWELLAINRLYLDAVQSSKLSINNIINIIHGSRGYLRLTYGLGP